MKRIVSLLVGLCLLVGFPTIPALADVPALPHAFYGTVEINDNPASIGTTVKAMGPGVRANIAGNPITVTETGKYGGPGGLDPKLVVQGDIEEGTTITFFVNDVSTGQTAEWHSGEVTELPLSVAITAPPSPPPTYVETTLFGVEGSFRISNTGEILETIEATSEDGMLTITIPEGTIALDIEGEPLSTLAVAIDETPSDPPEGAHIIGLAYDFSPDGATFDPGIIFEYTYDPEALPEGVAEEDLVIAFYDAEAGEWVTCDCTCDPEANCITACVCHFTTFAIIGVVPVVTPPAPAAFSVSSLSVLPAEVEPGEAVTIAVLVANTGGESGSYTVVLKIDGVKEAEETVTVAAGDSQEVSFSVTKDEPGTYSVSVDGLSGSFTMIAPPPGVNWPLIGGIIGGVILIGLLIFFLAVRRRAY